MTTTMRRRSLSQPSRALDRSTEGDGTVHQTVQTSTSVPIYAALVENRSYRVPYTRLKAFTIMEEMSSQVDQQLLQAFRPVAVGIG